jgi:hypothetical protein
VALPTQVRAIRPAAPADPDQPPTVFTADLVRPAALPGTARVAVAAIIVQTGVDDPESTSLTALATQLADDVREILQGDAPEAPVSAAMAVSGSLTALDRTDPRAGAAAPAGQAAGRPEPIVVDRARRYATVGGRSLDLTYREFELLAFLADHPGHVFSRAHLLRTVWDHAPVGSRTVDVHVRRLRIKLGPEARRLTTVRNVGYRLEPLAPGGLPRGHRPYAPVGVS